MTRYILRTIKYGFLLLIISIPFALAEKPLTVSQIIRGDTIRLNDGRTVQLLGVQCPEVNNERDSQMRAKKLHVDFESYFYFGQWVKDFLAEVTENADVTLEFDRAKEESKSPDNPDSLSAFVYVSVSEERRKFLESANIVGENVFVYEPDKRRIFLNGSLIKSGLCAVDDRFRFAGQNEFFKLQAHSKGSFNGIWAGQICEACNTERRSGGGSSKEIRVFKKDARGNSVVNIKEISAQGKLRFYANVFWRKGIKFGTPLPGYLYTPEERTKAYGIGAYLEFHENGNPEKVFFKVRGQNKGIDRWYYSNGNIQSERPHSFFLDEGKLLGLGEDTQGIYKEYRSNGHLYRETQYVKGLPNGICKEYYDNEQVATEGMMRHGELDGWKKFYDPNGVRVKELLYKNGRPKIEKLYDQNGNLKETRRLTGRP